MSNLAHLLYPLSYVCPAADTPGLVLLSPKPPDAPLLPASLLASSGLVPAAAPPFALLVPPLLLADSEARGVGPEDTGTAPPAGRIGGVSVSGDPRRLLCEEEDGRAVAFRESCLKG